MEPELVLPIFASFALGFDFLQLSRKNSRKKGRSLYSSGLAFGLLAIAWTLLASSYASNDFSLKEVYNYSSSSLPLVSKICASWAGSAGSILFLTLILCATYFAFRFSTSKNSTPTTVAASQILCILTLFFVIMSIGRSAFTRLAATPLDGAGLNPALQSPWMVIHPPIVFLGYAFVLIAFALSIGGMKTGELAEGPLLKSSASIAWLLMTVGIALGGLWAYEVLGWGGYWSWDPVETGSLIVWLALTAYFIIRPLADNNNNLAKQFTMFVAFASLIFLSALTRGGLLQSVHAYALSPAGPILIALALGFTGYFFYLKRKLRKPIFWLSVEKSSVGSVSLLVGYIALAALFLVSSLGVTVPILQQLIFSSQNAPGSSYYNSWSFPFAALLILAMVGYAFRNNLTVRRLFLLAVVCLTAGSILVFAGWPTSDRLGNMGIPLLFVGLFIVFYDLVILSFRERPALKVFGRKLLFFGMILGLVGILFSSSFKQTEVFSDVQFDDEGVATFQTGGLTIVMRNWTVNGGVGQVYSDELESVVYEHSSLELKVDLSKGSRALEDSSWSFLYVNYGAMASPSIINTYEGDIYMHLEVTDEMYNAMLKALMNIETAPPSEASLTVSSLPLVYLLWIGVVLMCGGIGLIAIGERWRPGEAKEEF